MTQLFINGREVALPTGFSFVLTEENPYFTQAGQFSDEIEIPLYGVNVNIFGHLNRRDKTLQNVKYDARIVVNNHAIVVGTATVTAVNTDSVSLQILGNNSDINYLTQFESLYIDEMDLGYACNGFVGDYSTIRSGTTTVHQYTFRKKDILIKEYVNDVLQSETTSTKDDTDGFNSCANGNTLDVAAYWLLNKSDDANFVCTPAVNTDSGYTVNSVCYYIDRDFNWQNEDVMYFLQNRSLYHESSTSGQRPIQWTESALSDYVEDETNVVVPQPYLVYVIERFVEELGYQIESSDLRTNWLKNVIIVNTSKTLFIKNMLPHWTATRFMTEVEHLFGVVFWFDSKKKTCRILRRVNAFSTYERLTNVGDSLNVEVDDESTTDISNANVVIDYGEDLIHHFDDTIIDNSTLVECDDMDAINALFAGSEAPDGTPVTSCVALNLSNGRKYILKDGSVVTCDQMGDLIRGKDNDEIELGILPAQVTTYESYVVYPRMSSNYGQQYLVYKNDHPILQRCPKAPSIPQKSNNLNIGEYIDGNDEVTNNTVDKMYVALFDGNTNRQKKYPGYGDVKSKWIYENMGWCWEDDDLTGLGFSDHTDTLQLYGGESINTLEDNWTNVNIDTTRKHSFTIYVDNRIDVRKIFVIDGKRYVCESVKYIIDENGLKKAAECVMFKFVE